MDLTILLTDNRTAYLSVPVPMTEEQWGYLLEQLSLMKRGLVEAGETKPPATRGEMTLEQRHKLLSLGYRPAEIVGMCEWQALEAIAGGRRD